MKALVLASESGNDYEALCKKNYERPDLPGILWIDCSAQEQGPQTTPAVVECDRLLVLIKLKKSPARKDVEKNTRQLTRVVEALPHSPDNIIKGVHADIGAHFEAWFDMSQVGELVRYKTTHPEEFGKLVKTLTGSPTGLSTEAAFDVAWKSFQERRNRQVGPEEPSSPETFGHWFGNKAGIIRNLLYRGANEEDRGGLDSLLGLGEDGTCHLEAEIHEIRLRLDQHARETDCQNLHEEADSALRFLAAVHGSDKEASDLRRRILGEDNPVAVYLASIDLVVKASDEN